MKASIDPIRDKGISWSADASAADALNRVDPKAAFVAVWITPDGCISWSKANTTAQSLAALAVVLQELARRAVAENLP